MLADNWREGVRRSDGVPFAYTCPAAGHYPWQWYWDSCFAAIARRRINRERSRQELESLLAAQRPDGFIGHTIFWNTPLTGVRRFTYNVAGPDSSMTASIQPPLLAWAWSLAVGDPREEPRIAAQHRWLEDNRELDGDGLLWIVQPDESGLDASPQFDAIWGVRAHSRPGFPALIRANRRHGFDARAIQAAGGPVVCEVATNVFYSLSRSALGLESLTPALVDRCWDERRGLFLPVWRGANTRSGADGWAERRGGPATWAALSPLALDDLPEAIGRRLVEEHLLDPQRFWLAAGPPSVAADEPAFAARESAFVHRYWRGPMWMNSAWLLWRGLVRHDLAARVARSVATSGLREYYQPFTGAGMGQRDFSWSALVLELI